MAVVTYRTCRHVHIQLSIRERAQLKSNGFTCQVAHHHDRNYIVTAQLLWLTPLLRSDRFNVNLVLISEYLCSVIKATWHFIDCPLQL